MFGVHIQLASPKGSKEDLLRILRDAIGEIEEDWDRMDIKQDAHLGPKQIGVVRIRYSKDGE